VAKTRPYLLWLSALLLVSGAILVIPHGDFPKLGTVFRFWQGIGLMAVGFVLSWRLRTVNAAWFWGISILTRLLLLPMYPGDDIWRYLWEGHIQTLGFSPYQFAPNAPELIAHRTEWWSLINHLDVSAIYPPVVQLGFWGLATLVPAVLLFKLAFVLADGLTCWLLSRRFGYTQTLLYAWNPLVIYSFAGGAHYDSWFVLPLVAAWLTFDRDSDRDAIAAPARTAADNRIDERDAIASPERNITSSFTKNIQHHWRWLGSALLIGLSIAVKWMSLPILAFLSWQALRQRQLKWAAIVLILGLLPFILTAIPYCRPDACTLVPTSSVFVDHGRSAELIPYLASQIWEPLRWDNWPYAIPLAAVVLSLLLWARRFLDFAEVYFAALFVLSPILHAWYFTWAIPFAVVTGNWGTRLLSLSAFVYFWLHQRAALGTPDWFLPAWARWFLWLPFILGWLFTLWQRRSEAQT